MHSVARSVTSGDFISYARIYGSLHKYSWLAEWYVIN